MNDADASTELPAAARSPVRRHKRAWTITVHTAEAMISDKVSIVAAGCAFYATLAFFPAISTLVFLYGLIFDPVTVEPQLSHLQQLLPHPVYMLIDERVRELVSQRQSSLTLGFAISTLITLWSSATGIKSLLAGLNLAHGQTETRGFFRFQVVAFGMTLFVILSVVLAIAILVFLPAAISIVGMTNYQSTLVWIASGALLLGVIFVLMAMVYRYGPARRPSSWRAIMPGTVVATILWLVASALFSIYVGRLATYDRTYGPLAAAVGVMMWLWVSVYVVLLGAELNAELEPEQDAQPAHP